MLLWKPFLWDVCLHSRLRAVGLLSQNISTHELCFLLPCTSCASLRSLWWHLRTVSPQLWQHALLLFFHFCHLDRWEIISHCSFHLQSYYYECSLTSVHLFCVHFICECVWIALFGPFFKWIFGLFLFISEEFIFWRIYSSSVIYSYVVFLHCKSPPTLHVDKFMVLLSYPDFELWLESLFPSMPFFIESLLLRLKRNSSLFSSSSCKISLFTFRSLIHLKFIATYGVYSWV